METLNKEFKILEVFGIHWLNLLRPFLNSIKFKQIGMELYKLKDQGIIIYPDSSTMFRAFTETPYERIKVILLGQDPYPQENIADGLAFSCSNSLKPQPSLKIMFSEIDQEYPEKREDILDGKLDKLDLMRWAKQGIFLYNVALSVEENSPGLHISLWKDFTIEVIKQLNKHFPSVVYLLLGSLAQSYQQFISSEHPVISAPHPASEIYGKSGFLGSGCFKEVNNQLKILNLQQINW